MDAEIREIARLLMKNNQIYFFILTLELSRCGITIPQAVVLDNIKDGPKMIGEISKAMDLSYSTVSGIVDRLERRGIVARHRDEKDRRVVWVSLAEGYKELQKSHPVFCDDSFAMMLSGMFEELSAQERQMLCESLQLVNRFLEQKLSSLQGKKGSEAV